MNNEILHNLKIFFPNNSIKNEHDLSRTNWCFYALTSQKENNPVTRLADSDYKDLDDG